MASPLDGLLSFLQQGNQDGAVNPWAALSAPQMAAPAIAPQATAPAPDQASPLASLFSGGGVLGGDLRNRTRDLMAGLAMGGTPNESLSKAGMMMAFRGKEREQEQKARAQQNQTAKWLQGKGVDAGTASYLVSDPTALRAWFGQYQAGQKPDWQITDIYDAQGRPQKAMVDKRSGKWNPLGGAKTDSTDDIKEYEFAKRQGFTGSLEQWMQRKRAGAGEYGLSPIWGTKPDGTPGILQLGKSGEAIETKLPSGFQVGKDALKIDAGTHTVLLDPVTRQQIGIVPKNVAEKEAQEAVGKARGEAQAALPTSLATGEKALAEIDQLLKHPGLSSAVGPFDQYRPNWTMGDQGRDALARLNQAKGGAFLQAYATLKGGGAITEIEGQKAENAIARLDRSLSEEDFKTALRDLSDAVRVGMQKLKEKAGVGASPQIAPPGGGWIDMGNNVRIRRVD